eukprot:CAMPEP_0172597234 /NCGR_PEP_ID=MMETSP1068-20121228/17209_1 /TAXON_ID=35684 /ORGANISM="Pseudopedinella elastica, Strain CCMP716" /LENGTH=47 /DNA_ID= /DNA_START= /DNA_END= /DNA_ORIENTATION=
MSKGEIARISIPPQAAYGESGFPPLVPASAYLFYDVELMSFGTVEEW